MALQNHTIKLMKQQGVPGEDEVGDADDAWLPDGGAAQPTGADIMVKVVPFALGFARPCGCSMAARHRCELHRGADRRRRAAGAQLAETLRRQARQDHTLPPGSYGREQPQGRLARRRGRRQNPHSDSGGGASRSHLLWRVRLRSGRAVQPRCAESRGTRQNNARSQPAPHDRFSADGTIALEPQIPEEDDALDRHLGRRRHR